MATHAGRELGEGSGRASFKILRRLTSTPGHERTLALFGTEEREVVEERFPLTGLDEIQRMALIARARALGAVVSPHLPRVVETRVATTDLLFVSGASPGDWLSALAEDEARQKTRFLALAVELRIVLDVLAGLSAMHAYRGAGAPLIHGAVAPSNVFVGVDGHTIVAGALRMPRASTAGTIGYLAPEIMLSDGTADTRADIYSACALLWEALSGKRLFADASSEQILSRQLSGALPRAVVREAWAEPLVEVAARGLAVDPAQRFATVNEIAQAIRMVAQARLAAPTRVGRTVESLAEERLARRKLARTSASPITAAATPPKAAPAAPRAAPLPAAQASTPATPNSAVHSAVHSSGTRRVVRTEEVLTPLVAFSPYEASVVTALAEEDLEEPAPEPVAIDAPGAPGASAPIAVAPIEAPPLIAAVHAPMLASPQRTAAIPMALPMIAPASPAPASTRSLSSSEVTVTTRIVPRRAARAKQVVFAFLLLSAVLFAVVSWAVLRTPTKIEPAAATVSPAPVAAPQRGPTTPALPPQAAVEAAPSHAAAPDPVTTRPETGARTPARTSAAPAEPTAAPARKNDRPRKPRTTSYEPEGI